MLKYIVRRTLYTIPILLGISLVTFILFNVAGGDPALQAAGRYATPERIESLRQQLGTNLPLHQQYFLYIKQIISLDFGTSWASHQRVTKMISEGMPASISLTIPAYTITVILSIFLGLILAYFRKAKIDKILLVVLLAMISLSSLVYILYGQYYLAYKWNMFPISGWDESFSDRWEYLALPIIIFVLITVSSNTLIYRTAFLDEIYQDYVRTAKSKGLGTIIILFKHVLKNALIPILTIITLHIPFLILGTILLESYFEIPGVGRLMVEAINNADFPVIKAVTFFGAVAYMLFQLLSDVLYSVVDPRVSIR